MKSIGIDIGTTTVSMNLVDAENPQVIEKRTLENGSFLKTSFSWERVQDTEVILSRILPVLEELLEKYPDVVSIGLTGQMHGIVYVNGEGKAVSPLYTWQDGRGGLPDDQGKSFSQQLSEQGLHAAPGYGAVTHLYNVKNHLVPQEAVSFCTIADYVGMYLTGRKTPLIHSSQAASLGLFDREAMAFQEEAIRELGMDPGMFPQVTQELELLGTYRGIPVSVSLGDNQASFLGSVRRAGETVLANLGTGGQISVWSPKAFDGPGIEARPFLGGSFLLVGATLCGGAAYAALEGFFREYAAAAGAPDVPQYDVMARLLEDTSQEGWQVKTTFAGTRENPDEAGGIQGIRVSNFHPVSLIRGVLNGMAEELVELYQVICQGTGISRGYLACSGNGARRNPALRRALEERFQMPVALVDNQEEAAFGAAVSALAAVERLSLTEWLGLS